MPSSAGLDAVNLTGKTFPQLQAALKRLRKVSIPQLFAERVEDDPDAVAVRYKRDGVFRELTWSGYREEIRKVAAGLLQCGLKPGARIAIMGDVSIEYLLADLAATFIGAIPCGVYPTSSPEEVAYVMRLVGARIFVAEDQEHLDRLLDAEATENAPLVDKIIVCDERALFLYDDPRIELFSEVTRKGREDSRSLARGVRAGKQGCPRPDQRHHLHVGHHRISQSSLPHAERRHHRFRIELSRSDA